MQVQEQTSEGTRSPITSRALTKARPPIRTCPAPEQRMAGNHVKLKGNDRKTPTPYSHDIYMPQNTFGTWSSITFKMAEPHTYT